MSLFAPLLPALRSAARYSYGAVVVAIGVELLLPRAAPVLLGPVLLVGLVVLGIAHGACDQLVWPAYQPVTPARWGRYLLRFLGAYLGLAAAVVLGWWQWPALMVTLFFLLTIWHWGSADAPPQARPTLWVAHSLLRGGLVFAVPALAWPTATLRIINGLLTFGGGPPLAAAPFRAGAVGLGAAVLLGQLALWAYYAARRQTRAWQLDLLEALLLAALFGVVPPVLALGVYFVFWHSLRHVLRLNQVLGYEAANPPTRRRGAWALGRELYFFIRRAWPLLGLSVVALLVLHHFLAARLPTPSALLSFALVVASVVTLPHALLVSLVMDAPKWKLFPGAGPTRP